MPGGGGRTAIAADLLLWRHIQQNIAKLASVSAAHAMCMVQAAAWLARTMLAARPYLNKQGLNGAARIQDKALLTSQHSHTSSQIL